MSNICERMQADINDVRRGIGHDKLLAARNQLLGMASQNKSLVGVRPNALDDAPQRAGPDSRDDVRVPAEHDRVAGIIDDDRQWPTVGGVHAQDADVGDGLAAIGEHHRGIDQHPAAIVDRDEPAASHGP